MFARLSCCSALVFVATSSTSEILLFKHSTKSLLSSSSLRSKSFDRTSSHCVSLSIVLVSSNICVSFSAFSLFSFCKPLITRSKPSTQFRMVPTSSIPFSTICDCKHLFSSLSCKTESFSDCKPCKSVVIFFLDSPSCNISLLFEVVNFSMFSMYSVIDFVLSSFSCVRVDFNSSSALSLALSSFICSWLVSRAIFNLSPSACKPFISSLSFTEDEFSVSSSRVFFSFSWTTSLTCFCK